MLFKEKSPETFHSIEAGYRTQSKGFLIPVAGCLTQEVVCDQRESPFERKRQLQFHQFVGAFRDDRVGDQRHKDAVISAEKALFRSDPCSVLLTTDGQGIVECHVYIGSVLNVEGEGVFRSSEYGAAAAYYNFSPFRRLQATDTEKGADRRQGADSWQCRGVAQAVGPLFRVFPIRQAVAVACDVQLVYLAKKGVDVAQVSTGGRQYGRTDLKQ